jgi:hypothetical protein
VSTKAELEDAVDGERQRRRLLCEQLDHDLEELRKDVVQQRIKQRQSREAEVAAEAQAQALEAILVRLRD